MYLLIAGQPKRKKQNVDALMKEAQRILDQSGEEKYKICKL